MSAATATLHACAERIAWGMDAAACEAVQLDLLRVSQQVDQTNTVLRAIRDAATHNRASELTLAKIAGLAAAALDSLT